jgi:muconolactone D-isomerase
MLTMVEMDVRIPLGFDKKEANRLKAREKERFQELQRVGKWRHIWRVIGRYANVSIFDVESNCRSFLSWK